MIFLIHPGRTSRITRLLWMAICALGFVGTGCGIAPIPMPRNTSAPPDLPAPTVLELPTASPRPSATSTASAQVASTNSGDWTTYHRDNTRTGYVPDLPDPQRLRVTWQTALDGAVYAEPLVIAGHVIVATEGDSVYSLDAQTGKIEWRTHIGEPVPRSTLPCGNINPLGITGTPVYDPATGLVFAVAEVSGPAHLLVGVDARTGEVRVRRSADVEAMDPRVHQQRAALALSQGMVYVAYGGLWGDCGNYRGRVIASRTDGSGSLLEYQVPTAREGGIWAPPGPSVDANGRLYVSVGNGSETNGTWDHSDSILRLASSLKLEDGFAPNEWRDDNRRDADLGSLGPVLLPQGLVFIAGKSGIGYVARSDALGNVGGQVQSQSICHAYGGAAVVGSIIFVPCNEGLQQVKVGPGASLNLGWQATQVPGSPVVGGHTVYSLDRGGTLHALDADTGQARATVSVGETSRFSTPTLSGDRIFIGTMTGIVAVTGS